MTARQLYEGVLIELNKENAPNILLEDFNYYANKAINNYVNKRYNIYDINQQTTDDLRVLKATAKFDITDDNRVNNYDGLSMATNATYAINLPSDYLHMLNCICIYTLQKTYKCYNIGDKWRAAARRLTADMYSQVLDNFWNKPTYKRPYYYVHNINTSTTIPTNNETDETPTTSYSNGGITAISLGQDGNSKDIKTAKSKGLVIPGTTSDSNVERGQAIRYGNASPVRLEIRYGTDNSVFKLTGIYIDYIKAPQNIRLTQLEIDKTEDVSQMLEYPDYVCQEIINELVHLIMESISDPRLQTHPVVSQSIANPAQQQTEPVAQQQPT